MHILIVEPEINGHHIALYVKLLAKELYNKKIKFSLLTSQKILTSPVFTILKKEIKNFKLYLIEDLKYPIKQSIVQLFIFQLRNFFLIQKAFAKIEIKNKISHVFMSNFELIDKAMIFLGSPFAQKNFSGILLNPKIHLFLKKNIIIKNWKYFFYDLFLKKIFNTPQFKNLFTNDILFYNYCKKKNYNCKNKLFLYREPSDLGHVYPKKASKIKLNLSTKSFVIMIYGALKMSKGIEKLINIFYDKKINKKIKVILSGEQTPEVKKFLDTIFIKNLIKNKKLYVFDKFINPKEQKILFGASDLIWLACSSNSYGSSGVLSMALEANIPFVTSNKGLVHWISKKYKLGKVINSNNTIRVLNTLCANKTEYSKLKINHKKFLNDKSYSNYPKIIVNKIII